jgi:hypothetical protein
MKLTITYPKIVFEQKEIEVNDVEQVAIERGNCWEKAKIIWNHLDDWVPQGVKSIESALDVGYATIKPATHDTGND